MDLMDGSVLVIAKLVNIATELGAFGYSCRSPC
jgi:hypothetical protein